MGNVHLSELNGPQRQAVETTQGPLLILAGAGTGKTRVLVHRLGHILRQGLARPHQILAVTFTNKAAHEMRERISPLIEGASEGLWLGTFHALCLRILRRHASLLDFSSDFTILDTDDQLRLIKQILKAQGVDEKKNTPQYVLGIISRWKDRALRPEKVSGSEVGHHPLPLSIYRMYQERLVHMNAMDFGDLLLHSLTIFEKFPEVLERYQQQFHYLLVDEYQDTNVAQYLWLRLLSQGHGNICCVGDEDQSIYAWRGADIGNILRFEKDFPGATVIQLEQNYRSTTHILGAATALISHNKERFGKALWTDKSVGDPVIVQSVYDGYEEARFVSEKIENNYRQGVPYTEMAILVRASYQTREFEERLLGLGIPYRVIGGFRFYERQEIRDAIAYLRLVAQPEDGLAFERVINVPRRGIGPSTLQLIHQEARLRLISSARAARELAEEDAFKGAVRRAIQNFFLDIDRWRSLVPKMELFRLTEVILDESGYTHMWKKDKSPEAPGRLENLKELVNALKQYDNLPEFLEHISLVTENIQTAQDETLSLMTLHGAKGLEFDVVFLPGWEEGIFPHGRSLMENGGEGLEEERRLAYVGLTRAKKQAVISYALNRRSYQGWQTCLPSRFIGELPPEHIQHLDANGKPKRKPTSSLPKTSLPFFEEDYSQLSDHERRYGPTFVREAEFSVISEASMVNFREEHRVYHPKFGPGTILSVQQESLTIQFDNRSTPQTILSRFVTLLSEERP